MLYETETDVDVAARPDFRVKPVQSGRRSPAPGVTPAASAPITAASGLPEGLIFAEEAAGSFRRWLAGRGLDDYHVFCADELDLHDVDEHLAALGAGLAWEPAPGLVAGGAQPARFRRTAEVKLQPPGCLHLPAYDVAVARWYWYDADVYGWACVWLAAARSVERFLELRERVRALRRARAAEVWQVVRGRPWQDGPKLPRDPRARWDDLVLSPDVRRRLESEVGGFFDDRTARLHARLNVPYRRGVLLHGPPGNGKTSIVRALASHVANVPALLLRPASDFDDDDFTSVIRRWADQAPALLAVEDLDHLLEDVNVSTFLNLLDGLDAPAAGGGAAGLLIVASTNNPEALDPAINNRPGRFDTTIEVPNPDESLRRDYFRRALPDMAAGEEEGADGFLARLADATGGLSFAHLREVVHLAGLLALHDGREVRSEEDLVEAAESVAEGHVDARRGFPRKPDLPFGLSQFRRGVGNDE